MILPSPKLPPLQVHPGQFTLRRLLVLVSALCLLAALFGQAPQEVAIVLAVVIGYFLLLALWQLGRAALRLGLPRWCRGRRADVVLLVFLVLALAIAPHMTVAVYAALEVCREGLP